MQRQTVQRQIVMDTIEKLRPLDTHLSIDEIYQEVKQSYDSISKTTVYRNLRQMAEAHLIRPVALNDGLVRYDLNMEDHHHFTCDSCQKVFDVDIDSDLSKKMKADLEDAYGFLVAENRFDFSGLCEDCKDPNIKV